MNTVGKILVILNFLFAIIVGGLVVANAALTNQWKVKYEQLANEAIALKSGRELDNTVRPKIVDDYKRALREKQDADQRLKDKEDEFKVREQSYQFDVAQINLKLNDAITTQKATLAANQRMTDEIAKLNAVIKERETLIVQLEADSKVFRVNAQNYQQIANARQIQNENLLEQLRGVTLELARLRSGVTPDTMVIANPNQPNPPAAKIDGKVEIVDGNLVQVSLGTDHGLGKNHTLDVYRVRPDAKYLGMIRIVDAKHHSSVGQLIPMGNAAFRPQIKQGDLVTSKITR